MILLNSGADAARPTSTKRSRMEILSLKLILTEDDLNNLVAKHLPKDEQVREVKVRVVPEGVRVSGAYPVTFFNVRFETLWALSIQGREAAAHLSELRVAGAPAGLVRGMLLDMVRAEIEREEGGASKEKASLPIPMCCCAVLDWTPARTLKPSAARWGRSSSKAEVDSLQRIALEHLIGRPRHPEAAHRFAEPRRWCVRHTAAAQSLRDRLAPPHTHGGTAPGRRHGGAHRRGHRRSESTTSSRCASRSIRRVSISWPMISPSSSATK